MTMRMMPRASSPSRIGDSRIGVLVVEVGVELGVDDVGVFAARDAVEGVAEVLVGDRPPRVCHDALMRHRRPREGDTSWLDTVVPIVLAGIVLGVAFIVLREFLAADW